MHEEDMVSMQEEVTNCDHNSSESVIRWSAETNWVITHGSLEASVTIESSDYPITESDSGVPAGQSPAVLKPPGPDSGPCEIEICFQQKYEIGQIYVRSTARVYEVYCKHSPQSSNEYLCTVRCGVAERDEMVLQTTCIEDVTEDNEELLTAELTEETVTDGGNIVTTEDDWVKIKPPEVGRSSLMGSVVINKVSDTQDLYEATAQISDSDPCSVLTIRLLSLQDKSCVYVDELYVFVDPVGSTGSGHEAVLAGSSTQSSLMAMFVPTLLQLSKSGVMQFQDTHASGELLKDDKKEPELRRSDGTDIGMENNELDQQYAKLKELHKDRHASGELPKDDKMERELRKIDQTGHGMEKNKVSQQYVKSKELDKDTVESPELQQPMLAVNTEKPVEPVNIDNLPTGKLERVLEQLISRVSTLEGICLRFEEKMLKPIESMDARLKQVEYQLEKLNKESHNSGPPHCTRISAPAFSCSESSSCSSYNEGSDYPPCGAPDLEKKDLSCDSMPGIPDDAKYHPSLVVSAPEFSFGEDEEENEDLNALGGSPSVEPKRTCSIDDALMAALSGFLSTAAVLSSEDIQTTSHPSSKVDDVSQRQELCEPCQTNIQESALEDGNRVYSQYKKILSVKAPEFTGAENGNQDSPDMASVFENEQKDRDNGMVPPSIQSKSLSSSADLSDFHRNEKVSASDDDFPAVSDGVTRTSLGNRHLDGSSELNLMEGSFEWNSSCNPVESGINSAPSPTKGSVESGVRQISDENSPIKTVSSTVDDKDIFSKVISGMESEGGSADILDRKVTVKKCFENDALEISKASFASMLDFEFPILEVKFTRDVCSSTKQPLEALLDAVESNVEAHTPDSADVDGKTDQINIATEEGSGTPEPLTSNDVLVDLGISGSGESLNLEGNFQNPCTPSSPDMNASLI